MGGEYYLEVKGEVHRIAKTLAYNWITVCEEVVVKGDGAKLGTNLLGRKCPTCFRRVRDPVTKPVTEEAKEKIPVAR